MKPMLHGTFGSFIYSMGIAFWFLVLNGRFAGYFDSASWFWQLIIYDKLLHYIYYLISGLFVIYFFDILLVFYFLLGIPMSGQ
jgi:hypothetical protein